MTDPKTPPMSAREWYNANLHKHVTWVSMLEAFAAHVAAPAEAENTALKASEHQAVEACNANATALARITEENTALKARVEELHGSLDEALCELKRGTDYVGSLTMNRMEAALAGKAEESNTATFQKMIVRLQSHNIELCQENTALKARVEELEKVLDKLARLGNEPHFGNSRGNGIAWAALAGKTGGTK